MPEDIWTRGYSRGDLRRAEDRFGFTFPADLLALLLDRRPVKGHDWTDLERLPSAFAWPFEGLLFDVEHNVLWPAQWGDRPPLAARRAEVLKEIVAKAPKLLPLIGHRYLPAEPCEPGNPVFSVCQSDIIYHGANLEDYFSREFSGWDHIPWPSDIKHIPFWSDLVKLNEI